MHHLSIRTRLILIILICQLVGLVAVAFSIQETLNEHVDSIASTSLENARDTFNNLQQQDIRMMSALLESLMVNETFQKLFEAKDRIKLLAATTPLQKTLHEKYGISHWYFHHTEDKRSVYLRVHVPTFFDDQIKRPLYFDAIKKQTFASGLELGKTAYALRVIHPFRNNAGKLLGYMELGEELDHFIETMKRQTGDEIAILLDKKYLSEKEWGSLTSNKNIKNTWNDYENFVLTSATVNEPSIFKLEEKISDIPESGLVLASGQYANLFFTRSIFPIFDSAKNKIGAVFVLKNATSHHDEMKKSGFKIFGIVFGISLLLALMLSIYLKKYMNL